MRALAVALLALGGCYSHTNNALALSPGYSAVAVAIAHDAYRQWQACSGGALKYGGPRTIEVVRRPNVGADCDTSGSRITCREDVPDEFLPGALAHELGHAIANLPHSNDPADVMNVGLKRGPVRLTQHDCEALCASIKCK